MLSRKLVSDIISHAIVVVYERKKNVLNRKYIHIHIYIHHINCSNKMRRVLFFGGGEKGDFVYKRPFVNLS
jgi:hypothetical protein